MRLVHLLFKRETAPPVLALAFASAVSVALVAGRILSTGNIRYGVLIWNLFLAWLPLVFALLACDRLKTDARPGWRLAALAGAWLLFFPNAPYIFTDLIHVSTRFFGHFWVDLVMVLMCALTGLVLGFLSLYLMQTMVARLYGRLASWVFIAAATALGGFGIYLGRFLRFNSWDVVLQPAKLSRDIGHWTINSFSYPSSAVIPVLFAAFLFTAYLMLYALTHLSPPYLAAAPEAARTDHRL